MKGQYYPQQEGGPRVIRILIDGIVIFLGLLLLWIIPNYLVDMLNGTGLFSAGSISNAGTMLNIFRAIGGVLCMIGITMTVIEIRR